MILLVLQLLVGTHSLPGWHRLCYCLGALSHSGLPPSPHSQKQQALGLLPSLPEATCTCSKAWRGDKCFPDNKSLPGEQTSSEAPATPLFCALNSDSVSGP